MSRAVRSKFATDLFYRLWDDANSRWIVHNGRSIWATRGVVENLIERLTNQGRNPATLSVERVHVKVH